MATYQLTSGDETFETTLDSFLENNPHLEGTYEELALRLLDVGDDVTVDEGAGGTWKMTRIA